MADREPMIGHSHEADSIILFQPRQQASSAERHRWGVLARVIRIAGAEAFGEFFAPGRLGARHALEHTRANVAGYDSAHARIKSKAAVRLTNPPAREKPGGGDVCLRPTLGEPAKPAPL